MNGAKAKKSAESGRTARPSPSSTRANRPQRGPNPLWSALSTRATAGRPPAVQRKCAACAGGGAPCPKCAEEQGM